MDDADLERAATACAKGGFSYAGQLRISVQRILVQESVMDKFLSVFVPKVKSLVVGDPRDESTDVGPMIQFRPLNAESWISDARDRWRNRSHGR